MTDSIFNKKRNLKWKATLLMYPGIDYREYDDGFVMNRTGFEDEYEYWMGKKHLGDPITKEEYDLVIENEDDTWFKEEIKRQLEFK